MRRLVIVACLLFASLASAQNAPASLPDGFRFPGQLITKLNSHKAKVGDEVKLELFDNILGPDRAVVIPKGAKLIGSVTDVKDKTAEDGQSSLSFLITKAEWHGGSMPLHAAPTAVTAPRIRSVREGGDSGGFEGGGRGGRGGERGGGGGGTDTTSMIAAAIAQEIKGVEVRDNADPSTGTAFSSHRDVSLPSGAVITLRQLKTAP